MKKFDQRIDLLRVLSMFLVIVIHVSNYYCRASDVISIPSYCVAVLYNILARVSVPIFFMISGALLLSKPYDRKKNHQRIFRLIVVLAVFTVIYNSWDYFYLHKTIPTLVKLLFKPERKMLWFLYVMIGLYIALPFTKCMVDNMDEQLDLEFVILWVVLNGFIYAMKYFLKFSIKYYVPILNGTYYLGYFMMGFFILKYKDKIDYKKYNLWILLLVLLNVVIVYYLTVHDSILYDDYIDIYLKYRSLFMNFISIGIFILLYANLKNKEYKLINFISPYSFGVYLVHGVILDYGIRHIPYESLFSLYMIPLISVGVFMIAFVIVYILRMIPFVKKFI